MVDALLFGGRAAVMQRVRHRTEWVPSAQAFTHSRSVPAFAKYLTVVIVKGQIMGCR